MLNLRMLCLIYLVSMPSIVASQDQALIDPELDEYAGQYSECSAYFSLVNMALIASEEIDLASVYKTLEQNSLAIAFALASIGRSEEIAIQVTNSRVELNMDQMKTRIENRNENISILINDYQESCSTKVSAPSPIVLDAITRGSESQ